MYLIFAAPGRMPRLGRTVAALVFRPWNLGHLASEVGAAQVLHLNRALHRQRRFRKAS